MPCCAPATRARPPPHFRVVGMAVCDGLLSGGHGLRHPVPPDSVSRTNRSACLFGRRCIGAALRAPGLAAVAASSARPGRHSDPASRSARLVPRSRKAAGRLRRAPPSLGGRTNEPALLQTRNAPHGAAAARAAASWRRGGAHHLPGARRQLHRCRSRSHGAAFRPCRQLAAHCAASRRHCRQAHHLPGCLPRRPPRRRRRARRQGVRVGVAVRRLRCQCRGHRSWPRTAHVRHRLPRLLPQR